MTEKKIGIILSGGTTSTAYCQLLESAEKGKITEGRLLVVKTKLGKILARTAELIPYNAFYTSGDPWSEVRRKGGDLPQNIARQYEICKLDLLMTLAKGKHKDVKFPPLPGENVVELDLEKNKEEIFGITEDQAGFIWYGTLLGYENAAIPLSIEKLPMHLAIFGVTGSGKSYDTGVFIENLSRIPINKQEKISYPLVIIDAHGDYLDYVEEFVKEKKFGSYTWIKRFVFPISYTSNLRHRNKKYSDVIHQIGINLDNLSSREIAETVILYYKGRIGYESELQVSAIETTIERLKIASHTPNDLFTSNYERVLKRELNRDQEIHSATKGAAIRAIDKFQKDVELEHKLLSTESELKNTDFVDNITKNGGLAILDFSADGAPGVNLPLKQLVMAYLAGILFNQFTTFKINNDERYLLFMIEEAQNFCPSSSYPVGSSLAHLKLSAIATQGRKFGLSLCLISQRPSFVDKIVLSMCNSFMIHRISPEDVNFVLSTTGGLPTSISRRLTRLSLGDAIITGQMSNIPFPIVINIPRKQRKVPHTAGHTNVIANLAKLRGIIIDKD
ncbi:MAG: ATP-binding protein [Candidatus Heimdallarchaeota archaeon]